MVLSRSRGGFTTKLHLSADGRCRPLSLIVTAGQRVGRTQFTPVLEKICEPGPGHGPGRAGPAPQEAGRYRGRQGMRQRAAATRYDKRGDV